MKNKDKLPPFLQNSWLALRLKHPSEYEYFYDSDDNYWTRYKFDIVLVDHELNSAKDVVIGTLEARRFHDSKASIDEICSHCAFDMSDMDVDQYTEMIWDHETHDLSPKFAKAIDSECVFGDIFLLMSIDIKPEYRGHDLGNAATWLFYRNFCTSYDVLVLLAFPLQFGMQQEEQEKCKPGEFDGSQRICTQKLLKYYEKLGFKRIGRSNFMIFNCESIMQKPNILEWL